MEPSGQRLQVNTNDVIAKVIDGEAIIINLSSGLYYSMDSTGATIWKLIEANYSRDEIISALADWYGVAVPQLETDIEGLISHLLQEELVRFADASTPPNRKVNLDSGNCKAWEPPSLNRYEDMGDLLALDPPLPNAKEEPWDVP